MAHERPSSAVSENEYPIDDQASQSDESEASWVDDSDTIENACKLFPVFCTADVPAKLSPLLWRGPLHPNLPIPQRTHAWHTPPNRRRQGSVPRQAYYRTRVHLPRRVRA
ncbi:MAG: hypothetical protein Q9187_007834 [Circinaria calcarea]